MSKSLWCRLGIHRWETHRNEEGQRYIVCQRCHKENSKITLTDNLGPGG